VNDDEEKYKFPVWITYTCLFPLESHTMHRTWWNWC